MTKEAIGAALLLLGAVVVRLVVTGEYLSFVKQSLAIPLLLSAALLLVLGGLELRASMQASKHDDEPGAQDTGATPVADAFDQQVGDHAGHHHVGDGPRMGILLLAPVGVLMLVPAVPLGAFAADNGAANRVPEMSVYEELPAPTDGAVEMLLPEVVGRAVIEPESIQDTPLRAVGFVVVDEDRSDAYLLSRFTVGCCAVDAVPFQLLVVTGGAPVPEQEQWVEAVIRFTGEVLDDGQEQVPVFELVGQELIAAPEVPYVY